MIKQFVKRLLPVWVVEDIRRRRLAVERARNASRSVRDVFSDIYRNNKWGGSVGSLYSGSGSRGGAADAYCEFVTQFIRDHNIGSIVDLGCGDFEIGRRIAPHVSSYIGIDVVPVLIESHRQNHASSSIQFECLDIIESPLPTGDLCLIRQVLQHLSNREIAEILAKLEGFR